MSVQTGFTLRGRNPDILTCIANLSNDEVFTPPEFANQMLDQLADAWAADNEGANIWADPTVTFLDPFTKSGVFLREITSRLVDGLAAKVPDLEERVDHILTKQVFGIAITQLTALLARRTLYCSKWANGQFSIALSFTDADGHIWFERGEHTWEGETAGATSGKGATGKCKFCGAHQRDYGRGDQMESHAYSLIHTDKPKSLLNDIFGADVQFDVVIGNPPYQLGQSGGEAIGSFAMPIYQKFVDAARSLDPKFIVMVIPSRWFAGGRGLDDFRKDMLHDRRIRSLVDFPESREVFAGVDIAGGISYFLWDAQWNGTCNFTTVVGGKPGATMARYLDEYDILIRQNEGVSILHKVLAGEPEESFKSLAPRVAPIQPFSLRTNFRGATSDKGMSAPVVLYQSGGTSFIEREDIPRNREWVDDWKVIVGGAVPAGGRADKNGRYYGLIGIRVLPPGTACTETYLVANRFSTEHEARNFAKYLSTKFARYLIALRTNTQHLYSERFAFVPDLPMDQEWSDDRLYETFGLTADEIESIERSIRPLDVE
jgi:site-specific DNA-methyltransferase (adenine-specific)